MLRKVILAVDGSPLSLDAAAEVGRLAATHPHATVILLHVLPAPARGAAGLDPLDAAAAVFATAQQELGLPPVRLQFRVRFGQVATEILHLASEEGADLIAVGSRGLGAAPGQVTGSISSHLLAKSACPVLIVMGRQAACQAG